jgi:ABC-type transport system involved in multi-copper enzyme maturation permease subunit
MRNLIMADLKVLGHRIWVIPLGVFLFIFSFSFIPYLSQVQSFQKWIFAILIPGLLMYELFREEKKSSSDTMVLTMPVSKEAYVWSKYLMIFVFFLIGLLLGSVTEFLTGVLGLVNNLPDQEINLKEMNYFNNVNFMIQIVLEVILFTLPVYYYTKKIILSIISGIVIFFATIIVFNYIENYVWSIFHEVANTGKILYYYRLNLRWYIILSTISVIILVLITLLDQFREKKLNSLFFIVIFALTTIFYDILSDKVTSFFLYKYLMGLNGYNQFYYSYMLQYKYESIIIASLVVSLIIILIKLFKKGDFKYIKFMIMFLFSPVLMQIFYSTFRHLARSRLDLTYFILVCLGLMIYLLVSVKASIYLLKNNRTLK